MIILGKELKSCRTKLRMTLPEMAKKLNVSTTTIVNYETGKRLPDIDFLLDLAGICEDDILYWLTLRVAASKSALAGKGKVLLDTARGSPSVQAGKSFVSLPIFDINDMTSPDQSAMPGRIADEIPQFNLAWLERELNATPADICMIPVNDDSMMPTLRPGDTILLDRRATKLDREGIYVLRLNGVSLVKRMQILPGGTFKVASDNQAYETFTLNPSDIDGKNIMILGRVVWVVWTGRKI